MSLPKEEPTHQLTGNAVIQNAQGDVVAVVTDINPSSSNEITQDMDVNGQPSPQHLLSTTSDQTAKILPPLDPETNFNADDKNFDDDQDDIDLNPILSISNEFDQQNNNNNQNDAAAAKTTNESRWNKDNRMILKQLMGSLPPYDIGAALRVILDTFGVESSKLIRRGEYIELDLKEINDDYILDSLWNYCAQMQFNIMSTLQSQQIAQQQMHYPIQHQAIVQPNYYQQPGAPQPPPPPRPEMQQIQMQQLMDGTGQMYNIQAMEQQQQTTNDQNISNQFAQ